jgi:hypothetical protein
MSPKDLLTDWPQSQCDFDLCLFIGDKPIFSSERMLHEDYYHKDSVKKTISGRGSQDTWCQEELDGAKPPIRMRREIVSRQLPVKCWALQGRLRRDSATAQVREEVAGHSLHRTDLSAWNWKISIVNNRYQETAVNVTAGWRRSSVCRNDF